uniref:FCP1 homology domain-containing protein n=1 Tax=Populus trichocarpa TaxID=3694 RepID=B9IPZ5_POPTR
MADLMKIAGTTLSSKILSQDKEYLAKLAVDAVMRLQIELKNPSRPGKKLFVLDIDYTLFDHRSTAETPLELMRPYLHAFLTAVYAEYL